jgi:hypothetical protein
MEYTAYIGMCFFSLSSSFGYISGLSAYICDVVPLTLTGRVNKGVLKK